MDVNFVSAGLSAGKTERVKAADTVYARIVRVILYVTVVLVPLFYLPLTSGALEYNKQMLLIIAASLGLVIWLLGVVVSGTLTVRTSPVDKGVLAVLAAALVGTIFSLTPAKSIFGMSVSLSSSLVTVLALTVFYFLAVNTLHDRGRMLRSALSLSAVLALVLGICQMFTWYILPGALTHSRAFNTIGSLNALGLLAAIFLPLFAKNGQRGSGRADMVIAMWGVAASIVVLGILNWWVLWLVALAGMLAIIAFDSLNATQLSQDYGSRTERFALSRFMVPVAVIILGAFLLLVNFNPASLKTNFPLEVAPSYALSGHVAAGVMKQKLLFGYGPENFSLAFDRFGASTLANSRLSDLRFFDATSEVLNLAVHEGAVGLLALGLLLWCLVQVVARFGGAISESVLRGQGAAFASRSSGTLAAAVAAVAGLVLYPFDLTLAFVWYALLVLAALTISGAHVTTIDIEERPRYSLAASLGFIVGLILVLSGVYFSSIRYVADSVYARALKAGGSPEQVLNGITRAINLDGSNDRYWRDASQAVLLTLRKELAAPAKAGDPQRSARIQNELASAAQLAQRATTVAPLESLNWDNLGQVYQSMTGLVDNVQRLAEDSYTKAADLRPGDPAFDSRTGQMWLTRADLIRQVARSASGANAQRLGEQAADSLNRAEQAYRRAIEKSPSLGLAIYSLGAVYDRQGKVADAIKQLEKLAPANANDPTLMFELGLLYLRANRHDDAGAAMQRAVLLAPQFANARWYLALLLEEKGNIDGALAQLTEIQKNNPENAVLRQKIEQLQAGQRSIPPAQVIDSRPLQ